MTAASVNSAFRLLEASTLKAALAESPGVLAVAGGDLADTAAVTAIAAKIKAGTAKPKHDKAVVAMHNGARPD